LHNRLSKQVYFGNRLLNVLENNYRLLMRLETMKAFFDRLLGTNLTTKKITFYMESNVGCGYY